MGPGAGDAHGADRPNLARRRTLLAGAGLAGAAGLASPLLRSTPADAATPGLLYLSPSTVPNPDDTSAINMALSANNEVVLLPGTFHVSGPILLNSFNTVWGCGKNTTIQATSSFDYMIKLTNTANTVQTTVGFLRLNPAGMAGGIIIDNTGYSPGGGIDSRFDTLHTLEDIYVDSANGDAFHFGLNIREMRATRLVTDFATGSGFFFMPRSGSVAGATDNHFSDCTAGDSGSHGWWIQSGHNMFTNCKAFLSGTVKNGTAITVSNQMNGFEVTGTDNVFVGCTSQQNGLHGWDLVGAHNSVAGCKADGNFLATTGSSSHGAGVNISSGSYCTVTGVTGDQTGGNQHYGIQVSGTCTGTWISGNSVTGMLGPFNDMNATGYWFNPATAEAQAQTVMNFSVIVVTVSSGIYPLSTPGAAVQGAILAKGMFAGQRVTLVNTSAFSIAFAPSGNSHVADGTLDVIAAQNAADFVWETGSNLWYRA
jgi:hypothetical protein